jgi:histidinol-phosphate phosphatase family protein
VFDVVVPTIGRASLGALLGALADGQGPPPGRIFVVDDRRAPAVPLLSSDLPQTLAARVTVLHGRAAGPATARNTGWRASHAEWIAFVDDDVIPDRDWLRHLADDLGAAVPDVGGVQGRLRVPLPSHRPPTDWERNVRGLETARWATADMAYRRAVLEAVGGFDEAFRRAYREDADLALRVQEAGWHLALGRRTAVHPVRPADRWVSVRLQAGNADDARMRVRHGAGWRRRAGIGAGRRTRHLAITGAAVATVLALAARRPRSATLAALVWLAGSAELAWARIAPGPRTRAEIVAMGLTSVAIPAAAVAHWLCGWARVLRARARRPRGPRAVLLDRDGTLIVDVPYNGDPARVVPVDGARAALDRLRAAGVALAVVSNQSGVARGVISAEDVAAVNRRVEELLGPLGPWLVCVHGPDDACRCRKPAPGMITDAARRLGVRPEDCVVIGDTGADIEAALAAGARGVLVPNAVTRAEEIARAPEVASTLHAAVQRVLGAAW